MPKRGDVVVVGYLGRKMNALVLAVRDNLPSHLGEDGEPLVTVALIDPDRETGLAKDKDGNPIYPIGRTPQVFIENDVVHETHEFDAAFLKQNGSTQAQILSQRGHGEWTEYVDPDTAEQIAGFRDANKALRDQVLKLTREASDAIAAQSLAEAKVGELEKALDLADSKAADLSRELATRNAPLPSEAPSGNA